MQPPQLANFQRIYLVALCACVVLGFVQTAHFYFYFEQPFTLSLKWSVKGSLIWLFIFVCVVNLIRPHRWAHLQLSQEVAIWTLLALFCGALQIFIAVFIDFLLGTASRPLVADFQHLYSKRFIQNTSIAALFLSWWRLSAPSSVETNNAASDQDSKSDKLKINDGTKTHWLAKREISHIESVGNYVGINTQHQQFIVRNTLTALSAELTGYGFIQINRSIVVNRRFIKSCTRINKNRLELETTSGHSLAVGRTYQQQIKEYLNL